MPATQQQPTQGQSPQHHAHATDIGARRLDSAELLNGQKAVDIEHNGAVYRLHTTKLGKLILTK